TLSGSNIRLQHRQLSSRQLRLKFLHPCRSLLNLGLLRFLDLVQLSGLSLQVCIIGETRTFPLDPLLNNPVKLFLRFRSLELGCLVLFSRVSGLVIFRHDNSSLGLRPQSALIGPRLTVRVTAHGRTVKSNSEPLKAIHVTVVKFIRVVIIRDNAVFGNNCAITIAVELRQLTSRRRSLINESARREH